VWAAYVRHGVRAARRTGCVHAEGRPRSGGALPKSSLDPPTRRREIRRIAAEGMGARGDSRMGADQPEQRAPPYLLYHRRRVVLRDQRGQTALGLAAAYADADAVEAVGGIGVEKCECADGSRCAVTRRLESALQALGSRQVVQDSEALLCSRRSARGTVSDPERAGFAISRGRFSVRVGSRRADLGS
jgi:hypothetical protein